jgi:hypothetical protein
LALFATSTSSIFYDGLCQAKKESTISRRQTGQKAETEKFK